jgi:tripartite ATP-independent transporter DctP family solute receptor
MKVFPSAQLGNERDVTEALQLGSVDVTLISAAPLSSFTQDFQIFDFPYIFKNRDHAYAVLDHADIGRKMMKNLEEYDLIGLELMENGFYWISNNKEITVPKDMAGIKIRSLENQMQVDAYNFTGANAIAMAFSEVFTALQNSTLDATGLTPSVIGSQKMYTVQKFLATTDHFYAAAPLLMSKATYDSMPEDLQKIVREAAREACVYQREVSKNFDDDKIKEMTDYGTKIINVDKELWIKAMVPPTYEKYVGPGKLIDAALYDQVKAMEPK